MFYVPISIFLIAQRESEIKLLLIQQLFFLLRKLNSFDGSQHIIQLVYRGLIESVLSVSIITRYGNVSGKNKIKLARVVNTASKLIGNEQKHLSSIHTAALKRKARQILYDPTHPLKLFRNFRQGYV